MKRYKVLLAITAKIYNSFRPGKRGDCFVQQSAAALMFTMLILAAGCSQPSIDKEIKADIFAKTKSDVNFAGVNCTVEKGVVTLSGRCSSAHSKGEAEQIIKSINIIKGINDQILIGPVTLTSDFFLKQEVDSVLTLYPAVVAIISGQTVNLTGKIEKQAVGNMLPAINNLHPAEIENNLNIQ